MAGQRPPKRICRTSEPVLSSHYPLGPDWRIAFLGSDGKQHATGIQSQVPVINQQGQTTDPGFDTTRFAYFDFPKAPGKAGDCN